MKSILHKLSLLIATTALLALGLMFSAVLLVFIVTAGIIAFSYLWWKSRVLRRLMREQMNMNRTDGQGVTIEGEVIHKVVTKEQLIFQAESKIS